MIGTVRYRAKQFFGRLWPQISSDDQKLVASVFNGNAQAQALFERMSVGDQQHAIAVLRSILTQGDTQIALQQAALLHDVGKAMGQPLLHRVVIVLLEVFWSPGLVYLSQADLSCATWRRPFVVHAQHPKIGAVWAEQAGCKDMAVQLIERHQEPPANQPQTQIERLHKVLYEADGAN